MAVSLVVLDVETGTERRLAASLTVADRPGLDP